MPKRWVNTDNGIWVPRRLGGGGGNKTYYYNSFMSGGPSFLSDVIEVNNVSYSATLLYDGTDATATSWPGRGGSMSLVSIGANPTPDKRGPFLDYNKAVRFKSSNKHFAKYNIANGVAKNDFIMEVVFKTGPSVTDAYHKFINMNFHPGTRITYLRTDQTTGNLYWLFYDNATGGGPYYISTNFAGSYIYPDTWYHWITFFDHSGYATSYLNGQTSARSGAIPANLDMTTTPFDFLIGGAGSVSEDGNQTVAHFAFWDLGEDALNTDQQPAVAKKRFAKLTGVYPLIAKGSYNYTVCNRSDQGNIRIYDEINSRYEYHQVGDHWPLVERLKDESGDICYGYKNEGEHKNGFRYTVDFNVASWTHTNVSLSSGTVECPKEWREAYGLDTASIDGDVNHLIETPLTPSSSVPHLMWAIVAKGAKDWFYMESVDAGSNSVHAYFNLSTGELGTTLGAGNDDVFFIPLGTYDGRAYYLTGILYLDGPSGIPHTHKMGPAAGDGTTNYTGTDTTDVWIAHVQHSYSVDYPPNIIENTTAAAITKTLDLLAFEDADGNMPFERGIISFDMVVPKVANNLSTRYYFRVGTGSVTYDSIVLFSNTNVEKVYAYLYLNGPIAEGIIVTGSDCFDGIKHSHSIEWGLNKFIKKLDNVIDGTPDMDTSNDYPSLWAVDFYIGSSTAGNTSFSHISNLRIKGK